MKKILLVLSSITQTNGISAFVFNYLENMPADIDIQFTILVGDVRPSRKYIEECEKMKIPLHFLPNLGTNGIKKYLCELKLFFKENHDFDAVYSHTANQSLFIFYYAKKYNINNRFIHSHATEAAAEPLKRFRNDILIKIVLRQATAYFACSKAAGVSMFGNKDFHVINNAVDYSHFAFNKSTREIKRKELEIDNHVVIGFVGRLATQKNLFFLIDIAQNLSDKYLFLIVGTGPLKDSFIKKIEEKGVKSKFIFIGECDNVFELYSAMDFFILPSLYEGLPVVGVEAQINGLKCLLSQSITKEVKISEKCFFLELCNINEWLSVLKNDCQYERNIPDCDKFDIAKQAIPFAKLILDLIK